MLKKEQKLLKVTGAFVIGFMPLFSLAFYMSLWSKTLSSFISLCIVLAYLAVPVLVLERFHVNLRSFNIYAHRMEALLDLVIPWQKKTVKPDFMAIRSELAAFFRIACGILIPYALAFYGYFWLEAYSKGETLTFSLHWPEGIIQVVATQIFVIAMPEEFFWRGFVQGSLLKKWPNEHFLWGIPLGRAVIITNLFFALAHFMIGFMPLRLLTFFPGLIFSALVVRQKSLLSAILFHALCNLFALVMHRSLLFT